MEREEEEERKQEEEEIEEEEGYMLTLKETFYVNNISLRRLRKVPRLINLASG